MHKRTLLAAVTSVIVASLLVAATPLPSSAQEVPEHGLGGDSSVCWDGRWPPGGVELSVDPQQLITLIPNPVVRNLLQGLKYLVIQESRAGTQVGADLGGTGHVYRDICGRFVLQACAIFCIGPRVTEGFYTSQRTHLYGGCGLGGEQVILNWDSDSTFKPGGNINNCPYGE